MNISEFKNMFKAAKRTASNFDEFCDELELYLEAAKKTATGEPDQDYDIEFFDEIVNQLANAGFSATHREFDKYQGVYLNVRGVDKFWIKDFYESTVYGDVYVFAPESDWETEIEVSNKDRVVDTEVLLNYIKSNKEASVKKARKFVETPDYVVERIGNKVVQGYTSGREDDEIEEDMWISTSWGIDIKSWTDEEEKEASVKKAKETGEITSDAALQEIARLIADGFTSGRVDDSEEGYSTAWELDTNTFRNY